LGGCGEREGEALIPEEYESWQRTTTKELDYPIPGHENNYRRIYINPTGMEYRVEERDGRRHYRFLEGSLIVKEVYQGFDPPEGREPARLTAMLKRPGDERARGGWIWILKPLEDGETGAEQIITGEFCVTCHSNANEAHPYGDGNPEGEFRDYVYFPPSRSEAGEN
jgi:hypothetical protein